MGNTQDSAAQRTAFIPFFSPHTRVIVSVSGGQESYPLRIFNLGRSGQWAADGGRSSAPPVSSAAPVRSEGEKNTRGVRMAAAPRLNPSRGGAGKPKPPQPKFGGSGGQRLPAKIEKKKNFFFIFGKSVLKSRFLLKVMVVSTPSEDSQGEEVMQWSTVACAAHVQIFFLNFF